MQFSLLVGIIFSFASIIAIIIQWNETSYLNLGLNATLVPLAGIVGGPLSAGIITGILLVFSFFFESDGLFIFETEILVSTAIIGSAFYYLNKQNFLRVSSSLKILLISIIIGLTTITILLLLTPVNLPAGLSIRDMAVPISIFIIFGLLLLGNVILYIDRKKANEFELIAYKENLEMLVQERTRDMEQMSGLHQATVESTADGIVGVDFSGNIRSYNRAAAHILKISECQKNNQTLNILEILKDLMENPELIERKYGEVPPSSKQLLSTNFTFRSGRIFEIFVSPHQIRDQIIGRVINFRDVTERIKAEESLQMTNQKLMLLSGITRHDILNQLTAQKLYLNLVSDEVTDPELVEYVDKLNQITDVIQLNLEFSRDYQDLGLYAPVWLNPFVSFRTAARSFEGRNLIFSTDGPDVEIYIDPLLERVFYNLIDNSIRHGERVSAIQLITIHENNSLIIRYRDDGIGVPHQEKEKIFVKGFGKHTGLGMFLIQEILSITGITIEETGSYGNGVQFDIRISAGKFKLYF